MASLLGNLASYVDFDKQSLLGECAAREKMMQKSSIA